MKKSIAALFFIVLLVICLSACGQVTAPSESQVPDAGSSANTDTDEDNMESVALLEGYPEDVLPLYKSLAIESCEFSYRDNAGYIIGKDLYSVDYVSEATLEEISEYYQSLLTSMDEYSEVDSLEGDIGDHHVLVFLSDYDEGVTYVGLSIGLTEDEYVDENPFFAQLPGDMVEIYGLIRLQESTYVNGIYQTRYFTIYESDLSEEAFIDFYKTKYGEMTGFAEDRDEYGLTYAWEDRGYSCHVTYSFGSIAYVTIEINPIEE